MVLSHLYQRHLLRNINYLLLIRYILDNSLDIRLNGKDWRIINDIDLLIKSLNFLADKNLTEPEWDGALLTYRPILNYAGLLQFFL